jgi:hypothetical protein
VEDGQPPYATRTHPSAPEQSKTVGKARRFEDTKWLRYPTAHGEMAAIGPLLSEHSCIKMERYRFAEFDFLEIQVNRVEEDIPFAANCRRWDQQGYCLPGTYPFISKVTQRFISRFGPVAWQSLLVESSDFKLFGHLAFD